MYGTESEVNHPRYSHTDFNRYQDEKEEDFRPDLKRSRISINNQIDYIFSRLTEKIYANKKATEKLEVRQKKVKQ